MTGIGKSILVTGATGLFGPYLAEAAQSLGKVVRHGHRRGEISCDLTNADETKGMMANLKPDVVLHAAALTDVDLCEQDTMLATALNRDAVSNIVRGLKPGSLLVVISTDQVYPNTLGPHQEDAVAPVNVYGSTKLAGEFAGLSHQQCLVLRANFFGPSRTDNRVSLSDFVVHSLTTNQEITLFDDIMFSPLHMVTAAQTTIDAVEMGLTGTFNLGCRSGTSKAEFGKRIARALNLPLGSARTGSSSEVASRAPRPKDLRLDVTRIEAALGRPMPTLDSQIAMLTKETVH